MEKYHYSTLRYDISNGHILLTYRIAATGKAKSCLVFEYNFGLDKLEYKLLVFPDRSDIITVEYIV